MAVKLAKKKPKWLQKISAENIRLANRLRQARYEFVLEALDFQAEIDTINEKYGTSFTAGDIFSITQEEEQQAIDAIEGEDDDD